MIKWPINRPLLAFDNCLTLDLCAEFTAHFSHSTESIRFTHTSIDCFFSAVILPSSRVFPSKLLNQHWRLRLFRSACLQQMDCWKWRMPTKKIIIIIICVCWWTGQIKGKETISRNLNAFGDSLTYFANEFISFGTSFLPQRCSRFGRCRSSFSHWHEWCVSSHGRTHSFYHIKWSKEWNLIPLQISDKWTHTKRIRTEMVFMRGGE